MKTKQDNNVTNCTDVVYVENDTEITGLIGSGANYNKNQLGQNYVTDHTNVVCAKNEIELP